MTASPNRTYLVGHPAGRLIQESPDYVEGPVAFAEKREPRWELSS